MTDWYLSDFVAHCFNHSNLHENNTEQELCEFRSWNYKMHKTKLKIGIVQFLSFWRVLFVVLRVICSSVLKTQTGWCEHSRRLRFIVTCRTKQKVFLPSKTERTPSYVCFLLQYVGLHLYFGRIFRQSSVCTCEWKPHRLSAHSVLIFNTRTVWCKCLFSAQYSGVQTSSAGLPAASRGRWSEKKCWTSS